MAECGNLFASLFSSDEEVRVRKRTVQRQREEVNALLTRIFLFTLSESTESLQSFEVPRHIVFLPHLALAFEEDNGLTLENFSLCIEERLQLSEEEFKTVECSNGIGKGLYTRNKAVEPTNIKYLVNCYSRADLETKKEELLRRSGETYGLEKETKLMMVSTCKQQVVETASAITCKDHSKSLSLSSGTSQFVLAITEALSSGSLQFFCDIAELHSSNIDELKLLFDRVLDHTYLQLLEPKLTTVNLHQHTDILNFFTSSPPLAKVLTSYRYWLPQVNAIGKDFEMQTILGKFLSPSSIKEFPDFFPIDRELYKPEVDDSTASVRHQLEHINGRTHKIFDALLRSSQNTRKTVISWLSVCLEANKGRGKMASLAGLDLRTDAGDGFFLNLSWVMLNLCVPFLTKDGVDFKRSKASSIDVTYCCVANKEAAMTLDPGGAMVDFSQDSKLSSYDSDEGMSIKPNVPFNFVTHCFFLTHKTLMLGMTLVIEKFKNLLQQYTHTVAPYRRMISAQVLGVQAHLLHPTLIDLCLQFYSTTAQWMVHLVMADTDGNHLPDKDVDFNGISSKAEFFQGVLRKVPVAVRLIPECLVDNLATIVTALRQIESQVVLSADQCKQYISLATIFMRSSRFVRNPHIRAKLAQFIHFIIYRSQEKSVLDLEFSREILESHVLAKKHLLPSLLSIFIDIEFTGESMEFEDKFVYRLPMYEVLEFLWDLPSFRPSIDILAVEVLESNFEEDTPIFLKFINMMINDATVQLDEGLENLVTIKEMEELKNSESWAALSDEDKKSAEAKLREAEMMAKNRNQLSSKTVHALGFITKDTSKPFVIPSMVTRIASMLNYVLKKLVGKDSKNLKVRDTNKYFFDPRTLVRGVISVYINLKQEKQFVEAVVKDGRSFSTDLFSHAERVISKVTVESDLLTKWRELSEQVGQQYEELREQATIVDHAPAEFLDPITSDLMEEPVILPTSGMTMDKGNIIRHLLSTSEDPFNRKHLTPNMLEPNHGLHEKIKKWKEENGIK